MCFNFHNGAMSSQQCIRLKYAFDYIKESAKVLVLIGAGGFFLALACDYVVASETSVLNPHYKTLGLSGSQYHTYSLPKRVGEDKAKELLDKCLPLSVKSKN